MFQAAEKREKTLKLKKELLEIIVVVTQNDVIKVTSLIFLMLDNLPQIRQKKKIFVFHRFFHNFSQHEKNTSEDGYYVR